MSIRSHISIALCAVFLFNGCAGRGGSSSAQTPGNSSQASQLLAPQSIKQLTVSGPIEDVETNQILIQAGAGCGHLFVNITPTTTVVTDGSPIAVGRYIESVGSGSCATTATATTLYVAASLQAVQKLAAATPGPSVSSAATPPVPTQTPAFAPAPSTGLSGQACLNTINGQQWALGCRPYSANAPWNVALPDSPAQHSSFPSAIMNGAPANDYVWIGPANTSSDGSFPVFFASASDKTWNVSCTSYCGIVPSTIHAPANIRVAQGPDAHLSVVERETGIETDGWACNLSSSTITCQAINQDTFITGNGTENPSTTSGASLGVAIRSDEMATALATADGVIPHVIPVVTACVTGTPVAPFGTSDASHCTSGTSVPIGTHLQYTPTFATIDAMNASSYQKVMLRTAHRYGMAVNDTTGASNSPGTGFGITWESPDPYYANGTSVPWISLLGANGFTNDLGSGSMIAPSWERVDPNFAAHLQIVNPCYALKTCTT